MAQGQQSGKGHVVKDVHRAMDNFKYEVARELNIPVYQGSEDYWGNISSRDCGAVGGHMVRKMIQMAEKQIREKGHV
jgi:small acid-soluble spore protein A (major alpha-type SASP)